MKIRVYEDLYRQYTRLEFTRNTDRPIAIAGLEKRLIRDLKAQGGLGVFKAIACYCGVFSGSANE
ncbi:hypothetical protein diail_5462, partial [Diaporthe ilicicola]